MRIHLQLKVFSNGVKKGATRDIKREGKNRETIEKQRIGGQTARENRKQKIEDKERVNGASQVKKTVVRPKKKRK